MIQPDFSKGLVPAIIQDYFTNNVLMLGYMNEEALSKTADEKKVTFFSRSKNRLWTKGETSGNYLLVKSIEVDCDKDTLLIKAAPQGPTCHKGNDTCFGEQKNESNDLSFLQNTISNRKENPKEGSYTNELLNNLNKAAQKVGEEAVELVIEAKDNNEELFLNEAADLMYHYLVLLTAKDYKLDDVIQVLKKRHS
ncbi:bifunctional phosphoribosyl-AMP cyclohydrolase/phosphoribosyl-ATP diphosphatase HisIE [Fulvivirga lutea]|uniref:Histidine biosynthesis bifunctional protein HisIE n=1 Tax=Fulvivirga lutea TaxID=2810512 RepID=A0A974WFP8_9BACT|nr:bifunctional phosphoribosyl-AMP cyclohydrolase/phosphoribosyl-ATP diphosphatase HisIE [Fulvivirga lutea]QSE96182.1 bifunctional phosphoribosyl-AMP cyclohydrolase/phosphoribosyl-ATP diphosphatase HisIE [Fulvivirga lutea]